MGEWLEGLGHLLPQFPGRNHHDGPGLSVDRDRVALEFKGLEPVQDRQGIGECLPATGLGNPDHGASREQGGHSLGLDLSRLGQVLFNEGPPKRGEKGEIGKGVHGVR